MVKEILGLENTRAQEDLKEQAGLASAALHQMLERSLRFETTELVRKVVPISRHRGKPSAPALASIPEWLLCTWHTTGTQLLTTYWETGDSTLPFPVHLPGSIFNSSTGQN